MEFLSFTVSIPADEGFVGRCCQHPQCRRYFKAHYACLKNEMYCPYCGERFKKDAFFTRDQQCYLEAVAEEKATEYAHAEIAKMLHSSFGRNSSSGLTFTVETSPYRPQQIYPSYTERKVDSELKCPQCETRFQIFGIFGFCPGCRT